MPLQSQTLSGQFVYQDNQEPVPGVEVSLPAFGMQALSNEDGIFGILLPDTINLKDSYRITVQVPGSIALSFTIIPDNMAVIPLARIELPGVQEEQTNDPLLQEEEPSESNPDDFIEDPENEEDSTSENVIEIPTVTNPNPSNIRKAPSTISKEYAQIDQTLNRVGDRLAQERMRLIERNQAIKEEISSLYQVIQEESKRGPGLGNQKELLMKKLAKLEQDLQENSKLYATLYEETQKELNRVRDVLSGGQDVFVTNLYNQKVIYTLVATLIGLLLITLVTYVVLRKIRKENYKLADLSLQLQESLHQRDLLLKEIHHRVKNNLQNINSILNLQSDTIDEPKAMEAIHDIQSRIASMALIHKILYQSRDLEFIPLGNYLKELVNYLKEIFVRQDANIQTLVQSPDVYLDIDTASSIGLIINELVSNSFKYAFPNKKNGEIRILVIEKTSQSYLLEVSDNGIGLPRHLDWTQSPSLGLQLVKCFAEEISATVSLDQQKGTRFFIHFDQKHKPLPKPNTELVPTQQ